MPIGILPDYISVYLLQGQHTTEQIEELKEKMVSHLVREVEKMHQFRQASYLMCWKV